MAANIDTSYIDQFKADLYHLVEQKTSKIRPTVKVESAKGESHRFDRLGIFSASERTGRLESVTLQDPDHSRRTAVVKVYEAATYLDTIDQLKMMMDPTSDYALKLARAHAKNLDDIILAAAIGTAATGKSGAGSTAFDTSNQQIAHGSAGFTVAKFNQALRILESNEVDIDGGRLFCALGARGIEDLLGDSSNQITSFDYQDGKVLSSGKFPSFRGVNIVRTQRTPDETADTTYRGLLYTDDTMRVAMAKDLKVDINERIDLAGHPIQVYTEMAFGAVRMAEDTIVDILYQ